MATKKLTRTQKLNASLTAQEAAWKAEEKATLKELKALKLPSGTTASKNRAHWKKRGGHAGSKVQRRVYEAAKAAGWTNGGYQVGGTPDGSKTSSTNDYYDPTGTWKLTTYSSYGVTASENFYTITVERVSSFIG